MIYGILNFERSGNSGTVIDLECRIAWCSRVGGDVTRVTGAMARQ